MWEEGSGMIQTLGMAGRELKELATLKSASAQRLHKLIIIMQCLIY